MALIWPRRSQREMVNGSDRVQTRTPDPDPGWHAGRLKWKRRRLASLYKASNNFFFWFFLFFLFIFFCFSRERGSPSLSSQAITGDPPTAVDTVSAAVVRWFPARNKVSNDRSESPRFRSVVCFAQKSFKNHESNFLDSRKFSFLVFSLLWRWGSSPRGRLVVL